MRRVGEIDGNRGGVHFLYVCVNGLFFLSACVAYFCQRLMLCFNSQLRCMISSHYYYDGVMGWLNW